MTEKKDYIFAEIDSKAPDTVQLMRTIKSDHGYYGSIELTKENLRNFKKNFDLNKNRLALAVDYAHMSHLEAAGWIKDIELKDNDTQLWISVDWTPDAKKKIENKEYRYLSADFSMKFIDNETSEVIGDLLHGAGLTNRPFIRGMTPILSQNNDVELNSQQIARSQGALLGDGKTKEKDIIMPLNDILKEVVTLSDTDKKAVVKATGLTLADEDTATQLSEAQEKNKKLKAEIVKLSADSEKAKKESEFTVMLSQGKAVEAQRDAFMKNDIAEFAKLSEELNTDEKGADTDDNGDKESEGDDPKTEEEAQAKLSDLAETMAEKDGIEFTDAVSNILHDPKHAKLAELTGNA